MYYYRTLFPYTCQCFRGWKHGAEPRPEMSHQCFFGMSLPGKSVLQCARQHPGRGHEISREFLWEGTPVKIPDGTPKKTCLPYNF